MNSEKQDLPIVWEHTHFDGALVFKIVEDADDDGNVVLKSFINDKFISSCSNKKRSYEAARMYLISSLFEMFQQQFQQFSSGYIQYASLKVDIYSSENERLQDQVNELSRALAGDVEKTDSEGRLMQ